MQQVQVPPGKHSFNFGGIEYVVDFGSSLVLKAGKNIHLEPKALRLLEILLLEPGKEVEIAQICDALWPGFQGDLKPRLSNLIWHLRDAFGAKDHVKQLIENTAHGYRFIVHVKVLGTSTEFKLAVLPVGHLKTMQDAFGDELARELIRKIGGICPPGLKVLGYSPFEYYKRSDKHLGDFGSELNVHYVVTFDVYRKPRSRGWHLAVDITRLPDAQQIWGDSQDFEEHEAASRIRELAQTIVKKIHLEPKGYSTPDISFNPVAREAYTKGRSHWERRTREDLKAACTFYEEAIKAFEIEAFHARAHAGVAESCVLLALGSVDKVERKRLYEKARAAAEKSLQLNPHLPEGHAARAELMFRFDRDWLNADEEFRKAIEPNPSYSTAHHWYSIYLTAMGRHDASKTEASKAQDLDPMSCIINTDAAWPYFNTGDYGKALKNCERALEIDRDFWLAHWVRGLILEQQGGIAKSQEKFREAIKEFEKAKRPWPSDPRLSARIARVYALSGETKIARTMLEELLTQRNATYVSPYFLAGAYEALKEHDNAIRCLKEAFKENSPTLVFLQVDPTMATLRAKSAVQDLLVQLRFPQVKEEIRQGRAATLFPM